MDTKHFHSPCIGSFAISNDHINKCTPTLGCGLYGCPAEKAKLKTSPPYITELHKFLRDVKDGPTALRNALYAGIETVSYPEAPSPTEEEIQVLKSYTGTWVVHSRAILQLLEDINSKVYGKETETAVAELRKLSPNLRHQLWKRNFCHCGCECQKQETVML